MSKIRLNEELIQYAVYGGAILGGGGGGPKETGLIAAKTAVDFGAPQLIDIEDLSEDTVILTAAAVGAPAAPDKYVSPRDYVRAVEIFQENTGIKVGGIITNENGGTATVNGWIQAAVLNIPIVDAPCNGRAHPTGTMGSMGLNNLEDYVSYQAVAGGNPELGNNIEGFFKGSLDKTARMVRQSSVVAGGLVAVARNPVTAGYVRQNGAIHGVTHAIETGRALFHGLQKSPKDGIQEVVDFLKGEIVTEGLIEELKLVTDGGFDVGTVKIKDYELTFWNEYMTLEKGGERLGTFPDLIMTLDSLTGIPVTSAEIQQGQKVVVIKTAKENLKLGSGMFDRKLMAEIEPIVHKEILNYIF
ncbi:DUF917 domain-containing protein [Desulfosporosinus metallidurans]|uniref:DUF917 family protein n=1 Tax=Desulfosporosinus metallidurans TaxID=1888891 RepID=A0A1Q8QXB9_9FIRM|nr:DUF917 family protein [Desulfosporosinus metallidurans]OLN31981.1 hypothetical protein DSOL_2074 [Desulfosporosinus metallidurans]